MAKMSPAKLPSEVRQDPGRQAEVAVFDALGAQLDDTCSVFYSVEWNAAVSTREPVQDGEADFLVCHPQHGFLVLEVKGGLIAFDSETQQWTSTSRGGYLNQISDPFRQARKSCHGLVSRTRTMLSQHGSLRIFHAVIFPNCLMRPEDLPGATSPEIMIDGDGMNQLDQRIGRAFAYWRNGAELRGPSYKEVLAAIRRIHLPAVAGYRNMSLEILEHRAEFDKLTDSQLRVLDLVSANRRLLVRGCAGSGKTFLAKKLAAKRYAQGERVLVLCFNNLLGGHLEEELGGLPTVTATNFHRLCEQLSERACITLPTTTGDAAGTYYSELSEAALKAIESDSSLRFDTIIIDEAQDFELDWWIVIEALLAEEDSSLTVFTDANQLLYGASRGVPEMKAFAEVDLSENVRNTQLIHREALRFFEGANLPSALGPEGVQPRWIEADSHEEQIIQLEALLSRLLKQERVSPDDIAVLTPKGASSTALKDVGRVGKFVLTPYEDREAGEVGWSTIRKFKGLESPVVIITELDDTMTSSTRLRELVYVGITRARDFLFVIGSKGTLKVLRGSK